MTIFIGNRKLVNVCSCIENVQIHVNPQLFSLHGACGFHNNMLGHLHFHFHFAVFCYPGVS